jgi:glutamyl-tRNA reductase
VRRAWAISREAVASTRELDLVFAAAIAAGRRVRRETPLGTWHASIGSVAVEAAESRLGGLHGRHCVIIGAGEAARGVAAALWERGARISVVARHRERAAGLVELFGGQIEPWERLDEVIRETDVIFAATSAPQAFLAASRLNSSRAGTLIVDLGVPRNVDPDAGRKPGIALVDLDDLHSSGKTALLELGRSLETARLILDREASRLLEKLDRWGGPVRVPATVRIDTAM